MFVATWIEIDIDGIIFQLYVLPARCFVVKLDSLAPWQSLHLYIAIYLFKLDMLDLISKIFIDSLALSLFCGIFLSHCHNSCLCQI